MKALNTFLAMAVLLVSSVVVAVENAPPRGAEIGVEAGQCSVGPFGQIKDAGEYEGHCLDLTREEICFAYIKSNIEENGSAQAADDSAKITFCTQLIKSAMTQLQ